MATPDHITRTREYLIRSGQVLPEPNNPIEQRWARDGVDFCSIDDFRKSILEGFAEIRARMAAGGPGWEPDKR